MKPTQEQIIAWAQKYGDWNGQTVEMNDVGLEAAYAAAYEAGQRDERNRIIHMGLQGFGGDACDFAEWLRDDDPYQNTNSV